MKIKGIIDDKEILEYILDEICDDEFCDFNTVEKILNIKYDYNKNILRDVFCYSIKNGEINITKILLQEYDMKIKKKDIELLINNNPMLNLLVENEQIIIEKK